jgi:hypothetical protein
MSNRAAKLKRFASHARARAGLDLPTIKFVATDKGGFHVGKDSNYECFTDKELIAHVGDILVGYRKFVNGGAPVYAVVGLLDDDATPPARELLGDLDEDKWPEAKYAKDPQRKKDPWQPVTVLPLYSEETETLYIFATELVSGHDAIGALADELAGKPDDFTKLPLVQLVDRPSGGFHKPFLKILDWVDPPDDVQRVIAPPLPVAATEPERDFFR